MGEAKNHGSREWESGEESAISATEAQNNFGRVLTRAMTEGAVTITKYDRPAAMVLSMDRYRELTGEAAPELDELTREFDEMLARMQTEEAAAGVDALFEMEAEALGRAAVRAAQTADD
ncbi:MAG TPA: type II toxin-antitoxin system prevent-host-death family antitoxin [Thermoanaerobaculia bacterium]|nr:type II toxin-antitoxin system prevent-host-death family antitoxin [Thermoanaerobaculia bacterium]